MLHVYLVNKKESDALPLYALDKIATIAIRTNQTKCNTLGQISHNPEYYLQIPKINQRKIDRCQDADNTEKCIKSEKMWLMSGV